MSSLLTNSAAMVALNTLRGINESMGTTQNRISTGLRVADASDNAAYWSIATTMKSDNKALSAVQDALGLGAATVDVAFTAMDKAVKVVDDIKAKLTAATDGTVDKNKIQSDIKELQGQLRTIAASANFSGENWLQQDMEKDNLAKKITGSFTRDASGATEIKNIDVDTSTVVLVDTQATDASDSGILSKSLKGDWDAGWLTYTAGTNAVAASAGPPSVAAVPGVAPSFDIAVPADKAEGIEVKAYRLALQDKIDGLSDSEYADFDEAKAKAYLVDVKKSVDKLGKFSVLDMDISTLGKTASDQAVLRVAINAVDEQLSEMTTAATNLGSAKKRITMQKEFVTNLSDSITRGVGQLVDADMNAESTRLKALQTQQQLGIQALSIANAGAQNILSLFR
ncbi:flagellin [Polycladidibacter hongkongensis]|uniref:flagellin N-terminal helical domain-containing protein n=1 Tax=Polycladidibacter hongkongensis TaxID=1647556 RepID=UPI00082AF06C|nr:flagellin [Pseudovibrio hongkongensis]